VLRFFTVNKVLPGLLLSAALATGASADAGASFRPDPEAKNAPTLQGSTWFQEGDGYAIRLQMIDDEQRLAFIKGSTGLGTDPFAGRPDQPPRFLSFLLEIENRTEGELALNPLDCWLMTNRKKIRTPLGLTDLSFQYHVAGADLPPAYETVGRVLLAQPTAVGPGGSLHGLLVYRAVEPNTKTFGVDVQLVLPDGNVARLTAPYRRSGGKPRGSR
jgi:hypothetical protein